jgi:tetratricopeptide (TPR) repeat protein
VEENLGADDYILRGRGRIRVEDYRGAADDGAKALRIRPLDGDATDMVYGAVGVLAGDDPDAKIAEWTKLIAAHPDVAKLYFHRGMIHHTREDYDRAIPDYVQAYALEQRLTDAWAFLRFVIEAKWDHDSAKVVEEWTKIIRRHPDLAAPYCVRGSWLSDMDRHEEAVADYTRAIGLRPTSTGSAPACRRTRTRGSRIC